MNGKIVDGAIAIGSDRSPGHGGGIEVGDDRGDWRLTRRRHVADRHKAARHVQLGIIQHTRVNRYWVCGSTL